MLSASIETPRNSYDPNTPEASLVMLTFFKGCGPESPCVRWYAVASAPYAVARPNYIAVQVNRSEFQTWWTNVVIAPSVLECLPEGRQRN